MQAVVDIGSNSVKFLAGRVQRNAIESPSSASFVTRLGRDLEKTGLLSQKSITDSVAAFQQIKSKLDEAGVTELRVVATSAVRDCKNPGAIAESVQKIFGVPLQILSGQEEAFYSLQGAAAAARLILQEDDCVFIDVGGASTEVSVHKPQFLAHSFQAGAVRCHERLGLPNGAISVAVWAQAKKRINEFFPDKDLEKLFASHSNSRPIVAVGGTLVLAAKIAGSQLERGCGIRISCEKLEALNEELRKMPIEDRMQLPGMEAGRADIVCAGVLVLTSLIRRLAANEAMVTTWGLRHGILMA